MPRPPFSSEQIEIAARSFVAGAIEAFMPTEFEIEPISGLGIGTYERMDHIQRETARLQRAARKEIVDRCLKLAERSRRLRLARAA